MTSCHGPVKPSKQTLKTSLRKRAASGPGPNLRAAAEALQDEALSEGPDVDL